MEGHVAPKDYPWYVKIGRLGARSRKAQLFWCLASIVFGCIVLAFSVVLSITGDPGAVTIIRFAIAAGGVGGFVAAFMYWLVIRWMDRYGDWAT